MNFVFKVRHISLDMTLVKVDSFLSCIKNAVHPLRDTPQNVVKSFKAMVGMAPNFYNNSIQPNSSRDAVVQSLNK